MAERLSALAHMTTGAADGASIVLGEERPAAILQIRAWPDTLDTVDAVITQTLGLAAAPPPGTAVTLAGGSLCATGTGRFLLSASADDVAATFRTAFSSADAAVTDISHGRTVLSLEGGAAAELLSRCVALDFDAAVFPPGRVAQTAIHHVDVLIHRLTESRFEIWALRSFAESLAEWLLDAGAGLGVRFRGSGN
jgi:heterotetrameric sarcosine oxidase gamma subunit